MVQFECPRVIHLLVSVTFLDHCTVGYPFLSMQEKRKDACGLLIKWKSILQK